MLLAWTKSKTYRALDQIWSLNVRNGFLVSLYLKTVGVKSPGLKKIFCKISDTLTGIDGSDENVNIARGTTNPGY